MTATGVRSGFCFGGTGVLDLRGGADVAGVVSFPAISAAMRRSRTPSRPACSCFTAPTTALSRRRRSQRSGWMRAARADWQFVSYGGAVHCFAIPTATGATPGCKYDERTARRAYAQMRAFFTEAFGGRD
ncbi:MAG: dienelactone hydrolase family protein [Dokdonella sp.]|nr:dienelactone hydrolase family protein [Dokdonella sp.]